jgi:hypothetical protein
MPIYLIEWTHGDGMDQHQEVAVLTADQANTIRAFLAERGALDPHVYEAIATNTFEDLVEVIEDDLPMEDDE